MDSQKFGNLPLGDFLKSRMYGLLSTYFHNGHLSCVAFHMNHTSHTVAQGLVLWARTSQASPILVFLQRHSQHQPVPGYIYIPFYSITLSLTTQILTDTYIAGKAFKDQLNDYLLCSLYINHYQLYIIVFVVTITVVLTTAKNWSGKTEHRSSPANCPAPATPLLAFLHSHELSFSFL